jgi:hypothetical protein
VTSTSPWTTPRNSTLPTPSISAALTTCGRLDSRQVENALMTTMAFAERA